MAVIAWTAARTPWLGCEHAAHQPSAGGLVMIGIGASLAITGRHD
jgi:hypothetical protein